MKEKIRQKLPEIKRDIKEFVSDERGFVSKDKILKAAFVLGAASLFLASSAAAQADHTQHINELSSSFSDQTLTGSHSHHGQHTSY